MSAKVYIGNDHDIQLGVAATADVPADLLRDKYSGTAKTGITITCKTFTGPKGTNPGDNGSDVQLGSTIAAMTEETAGVFTATVPAANWASQSVGSYVYFQLACASPLFEFFTDDHLVSYRGEF